MLMNNDDIFCNACLETVTFLSLNFSDITNAISLFIFLVVNTTCQIDEKIILL